MSGMEKLLARIKALFAPSPPVPPPPEPEVVQLMTVAEPPPAEEAPALLEQAPAVAETIPPVAAEVPAPPDEAPSDVAPAIGEGLILRLETERGMKSTFQVTKTGATIGRGPESTIQLADLSVSRKHAKITYKQGAYWLSDLGSMGGTWVDGSKLAAPRRVEAGQMIDIGVCRLRVVAAAEAEKSGAAKG